MILILDHRNDERPIPPQLLSPEPRLRKCSKRTCLRRLGVYLPEASRSVTAPAPAEGERLAPRRSQQ